MRMSVMAVTVLAVAGVAYGSFRYLSAEESALPAPAGSPSLSREASPDSALPSSLPSLPGADSSSPAPAGPAAGGAPLPSGAVTDAVPPGSFPPPSPDGGTAPSLKVPPTSKEVKAQAEARKREWYASKGRLAEYEKDLKEKEARRAARLAEAAKGREEASKLREMQGARVEAEREGTMPRNPWATPAPGPAGPPPSPGK